MKALISADSFWTTVQLLSCESDRIEGLVVRLVLLRECPEVISCGIQNDQYNIHVAIDLQLNVVDKPQISETVGTHASDLAP